MMNVDNRLKEKLAMAANAKCPIFLRKSYHMISSCDNNIASWSDDGLSFLVKNVEVFAAQILPQYFKHSNFSSFVRQLNFYGFTKAKDIRITNKDDSKFWQFRHEHFSRDSPELLVKIVRRIANQTNTGPQEIKGKTLDPKSKKECDEMVHEIASLRGKLSSMENAVKKLTDAVSAVKIGATTHVKDVKIEENIPPIGSSKKKQKILLKESELFETGVSDTSKPQSSIAQNTSRLPGPMSNHVASTDLPDLSSAIDSDLLVGIQGCATKGPSRSVSSASSSSRSGSFTGANEPLNELASSQVDLPDINMSLVEDDQIISSLALNSSAAPVPDHINSTLQEPLPVLVVDDGHEPQQEPPIKQVVRTGRNLLDSSHLLNLERSLAMLPIQDRIDFVQNVMNDISGLDDLVKRGLTVTVAVINSETETKNQATSTSLSRARQVIESGIDTSLLLELESLLSRVGLRIQISGQDQRVNNTCASSTSNSTAKKSKESSYVNVQG